MSVSTFKTSITGYPGEIAELNLERISSIGKTIDDYQQPMATLQICDPNEVRVAQACHLMEQYADMLEMGLDQSIEPDPAKIEQRNFIFDSISNATVGESSIELEFARSSPGVMAITVRANRQRVGVLMLKANEIDIFIRQLEKLRAYDRVNNN